MKLSKIAQIALLSLTLAACSTARDADISALTCAERLAGQALSFDVNVLTRDGQTVPVTVYYPSAPGEYGVIAFSHGAFATPRRYEAMLKPLAAGGHIVIAPMHRDSEEFPTKVDDDQAKIWQSRNQDLALAMTVPDVVRTALNERGVQPNSSAPVAMGHSYGALIAQLAGGAKAMIPRKVYPSSVLPNASAVIAWSPPGRIPGMMEAKGWSSMAVPNLTITGTADVLPGFIDDWRLHTESFENAPAGEKSLWVGEGVDHYFGGSFGRVKLVSPKDAKLFQTALQRSLQFIDAANGEQRVCAVSDPANGESFKKG